MSKEHIFHESVLTKSQADAILSALKSIDSTYAPKAPPLPARTQMPDGRLFEKLKEPADEKIDSFLSEVSAEELCGMFEKQLANEMRGMYLRIYRRLVEVITSKLSTDNNAMLIRKDLTQFQF